MACDTKGINFKDLTIDELVQLQNSLSKKRNITPREASIYWETPLDAIYKFIKEGKIIAFHPFGVTSKWLIDVKKSEELLYSN